MPLSKLLLDPNNPRFLEDHTVRVEEQEFAHSGVQNDAASRMSGGNFRLEELKRSIQTNGWQPVDMIFVRALKNQPGHYVVLEGNRRLMALRDLKRSGELSEATLKAADPLSVLEVIGDAGEEEYRAQITYLLGVRHHGSLKTWGPFAQAHNLYERYLQLGRMTDATFAWDEAVAKKIGAQLSVDVPKIEERLRVYIAMKQLHGVPEIAKVGIKGKYYSLVKEALPPWTKSSPLRQYVVQDQSNFQLDLDTLSRLDTICHFSSADRAEAPISSPDEWRALAKILNDNDLEKKAEMLGQVEKQKRSPSDVYADRAAELRQPRWDRWLVEVSDLLKRLTIGNVDTDSSEAKEVATRLARILDALGTDRRLATAGTGATP